MVIKSLTITEDAYDALKAMKYADESFSEVILRIEKNRVLHVQRFFGIWKKSDKEVKQLLEDIKKNRGEFDGGIEKRQEQFRRVRHGSS